MLALLMGFGTGSSSTEQDKLALTFLLKLNYGFGALVPKTEPIFLLMEPWDFGECCSYVYHVMLQ